MHPIIRKLKADHNRFAHLVKHMELTMERCQHGEGVDVGTLELFIAYCSGHADEHHHPLEALLFSRMLAADPKMATLVGRIDDEHEQLHQATEKLISMTGAMANHDFVPRAKFLAALENYLALYRQHMKLEEAELFPRADDLLNEDDWQAIEQWLARRPPSPFDNEESAEYERIEDLLAR